MCCCKWWLAYLTSLEAEASLIVLLTVLCMLFTCLEEGYRISCLFSLLWPERGSQLVWVNGILSTPSPLFRVLGSGEAYNISLVLFSMLTRYVLKLFCFVVSSHAWDIGQGATFTNHVENITTNCRVNTNHGSFCTLERSLPLYWCQ